MLSRLNRLLSGIEWRWSLWSFIQAAGLVSGVVLPAWATHATGLFVEYSPLSWVLAGMTGFFVISVCYTIFMFGRRLRIRAKYDEKHLQDDTEINPLDKTFEGKRIFLNSFVLPSHPFIQNKTFIDCEIIGPGNIYLRQDNSVTKMLEPKIDTVYLEKNVQFYNGFVFDDCLFKNCSFQRVTLFVRNEEYNGFAHNLFLNWISPTPATINFPELPFEPAHLGRALDEFSLEDEDRGNQ